MYQCNNNTLCCLHGESHYESSPGECRLSARWPPILRPSQPSWAVCPPLGCHHSHHHRHMLLLLSSKAGTHFTISRRVESWVDLGTAVINIYIFIIYSPYRYRNIQTENRKETQRKYLMVCSPCPRLYNALAVDHCDLYVGIWVWSCEQLALGCCPIARRLGTEFVIIESRVRRPSHN